jgi:hypothetical protein
MLVAPGGYFSVSPEAAIRALENGLRIHAERVNRPPKRTDCGLTSTMPVSMAGSSARAGRANRLDTVVRMRNNIGHGRPQLLQPLSVEGMRLCMEILNRTSLFEGGSTFRAIAGSQAAR